MADLFSLRARKRNGFIALELCIVTVLVFTLAATVMLPRAWQNDRHKLDVLVDELALDLNTVRQYAIGNHLGEIDIWSIVVQDGEYRIMHNYRIEKSFPLTKRDALQVRICALPSSWLMIRIKKRLSLQPRRDEYELKKRKNGFMLTDLLCAMTIALLLFVPSLGLLRQSELYYERSRRLQELVLAGRSALAEAETTWPPLEDTQNEQVFQQQSYGIRTTARPLESGLLHYEVEVTNGNGEKYVLLRVWKMPEAEP